MIGHKVTISPFFHFSRSTRSAVWAESPRSGASCSFYSRRRRGVVNMSMGDHNVRNGFAPHRFEQRINMFRKVWARIYNGNFPVPDDVGPGSMKREHAWVTGYHTPYQR